MFLTFKDISVFVKKNFRRSNPGKPGIFFLHGFGGSSGDWEEIISLLDSDFQLIAIDLPGFGKSSKPDNTKFYQTKFLVQLISDISCRLKLTGVVLTGYSMGGRLALQFANKYPGKIKALILESSSPGLKTKLEQKVRRKYDADLISFIKNNTLIDFFTFWQNQPLFASQKNLPQKKQISTLKKKTRSNSKTGLSNSLRCFGQGEMKNLWCALPEIKIPTLLLSGSLDAKYTAIQNEMETLFPNSIHKIIEDAGHNLHLEKPKVFVNLIREFLQTLK